MRKNIIHTQAVYGKDAEQLERLFQDWQGWEATAEYYCYDDAKFNQRAQEAAEAYDQLKAQAAVKVVS